MDPIKHTQYPIVTGASVIAVSYNGGIILGADTLASYGSMARYKGVCRLSQVGSSTIVGGTGEMSDFQQMSHMLDDIDGDDDVFCLAAETTAPTPAPAMIFVPTTVVGFDAASPAVMADFAAGLI